MADAIYPKFKEALLKGDVDLDTADLRVAFVTSSYTYNAAHDFHDDLAGIVATSASFTAATLTNGALDFADVNMTGLDTDETAAAYVLYIWTGTSATSQLVAYKDSATATLKAAMDTALGAAGFKDKDGNRLT